MRKDGLLLVEGVNHKPYGDNKTIDLGIIDSSGKFIINFGEYDVLYINNGGYITAKKFIDSLKTNSYIFDRNGELVLKTQPNIVLVGEVNSDEKTSDAVVKIKEERVEVTISFMEEKPISMELPNNIECTIETTDAAIKNQTASSSYKPALLDCGIKINVPPFIESGEKIIIDTRTLEYVKRVS